MVLGLRAEYWQAGLYGSGSQGWVLAGRTVWSWISGLGVGRLDCMVLGLRARCWQAGLMVLGLRAVCWQAGLYGPGSQG